MPRPPGRTPGLGEKSSINSSNASSTNNWYTTLRATGNNKRWWDVWERKNVGKKKQKSKQKPILGGLLVQPLVTHYWTCMLESLYDGILVFVEGGVGWTPWWMVFYWQSFKSFAHVSGLAGEVARLLDMISFGYNPPSLLKSCSSDANVFIWKRTSHVLIGMKSKQYTPEAWHSPP